MTETNPVILRERIAGLEAENEKLTEHVKQLRKSKDEIFHDRRKLHDELVKWKNRCFETERVMVRQIKYPTRI